MRMQKLLLSFLLLTKLAYSFELNGLKSEDIYPFDDKPELSWKEFEKNFRTKYTQLDIPQIEIYPFSAKAEYSLGISNTFFSFPAKINFDPYSSLSSHNAEWTLLHEAGHHNYDAKLRKNNKEDAKKIYENCCSFTKSTLGLSEKMLMVANCYHILFRKPHIKMLLGQGIVRVLLERSEFFYKETVFKYYRDKPEEIAADSFANQHASKEALEDIIYRFSRDGYCENEIKNSLSRENYVIEQELKKQKPNKQLIKKSENIIRGINFIRKHCINSIGTSLYMHHSWKNCFSHGTPYERQQASLKAYNDRFKI